MKKPLSVIALALKKYADYLMIGMGLQCLRTNIAMSFPANTYDIDLVMKDIMSSEMMHDVELAKK